MSTQLTRLQLNAHPSYSGPVAAAVAEDDAQLREVLKHCAPSTYAAACDFRKTARPEHLRTIVHGVIDRYVEPDLRARLREPDDDLRLIEDLGLDSLTLMEIVIRLEDVLRISIRDEELRYIHTVGEVRRLIERNVASHASVTQPPSPSPA